MIEDVPAGALILAFLASVASAFLVWLRRERYRSPYPARLWDMLENFALMNLMIIMVVAAIIQVTVRFLLSDFIIVGWTAELSSLCLVWLTFLAGAVIIRGGGHIAFEVIYLSMPARFQRANLIFIDILTILILTPIAWYGYHNALSLEIVQTVSLGMSMAAFAYAISVSLSLMIVLAFFQLVKHVRGPSAKRVRRKRSQ